MQSKMDSSNEAFTGTSKRIASNCPNEAIAKNPRDNVQQVHNGPTVTFPGLANPSGMPDPVGIWNLSG